MFITLLITYLVALGLIAVTIKLRHRSRGARAHFIADGQLSGWVTGCSLAVTSVGGSSIVITSALVYRHGLAGIWMDLSGALGFLVLGLWLARRVRETGVASIAELAGLRYGLAVRRMVALLVLLAELGWLALQARSTAAVVGPALPSVDPWIITATTLAVVVGYTLLGGQRAVSYTDVVQIVIMALGLVLLAPLAAGAAVGVENLSQLQWSFPFSHTFGWQEMIGFWVLAGLPHLVGSDIYAKLLSARDGAAAARGAYLAALFKLVFGAAFAFLALSAHHLMPQLERPDQALSLLVQRVLPAGVAALVLLGLVATLQSTADQVLLSAVTMVGHDLLPRRGVITLSTIGLGLVAFAIAQAFPSVIDLMKVAYTLFASGLTLPILAALIPRISLPRAAVMAAMGLGSSTGGVLHILRLQGVAVPGDPVLWGLAASLACLLLGSLWTGRAESG